MTTATDDLRLAADFPPATHDDWRKLVDGVLKGAPFEKLVGKTSDGLKIEPIYRARQGRRAGRRPRRGRAVADHAADRSSRCRGGQCAGAARSGKRRDRADAGVRRRPRRPRLRPGADGRSRSRSVSRRHHPRCRHRASSSSRPAVADGGDHLAESVEAQRHRSRQRAISASVSIRSPPARSWGRSRYSWAEIVPAVTGGDQGPRRAAASRDRSRWPTAGRSTMPADRKRRNWPSCWHRRRLSARARSRRHCARAARRAWSIPAPADADQFLTMAKFRALRLLWARVEQACGLTPKPLFIAAETAWRMLTQRDPYVNMLRATMATFSAGLGGANAITVLPHTLALGLPDAVRAPRGAQHATGAAGGIQSRQGVRSRGRLRRHRDADQGAVRSGLGAVPGDRKSRRRVCRASAGPDPEQGRGHARRARPISPGAATC